MDPVLRMKNFLVHEELAPEAEVEKIDREIVAEIEEAIRYAAEECSEPSLDSLYDNIYADNEVIR
jgi:pyruvate dehydrogenase E1 component alpha subunit